MVFEVSCGMIIVITRNEKGTLERSFNRVEFQYQECHHVIGSGRGRFELNLCLEAYNMFHFYFRDLPRFSRFVSVGSVD